MTCDESTFSGYLRRLTVDFGVSIPFSFGEKDATGRALAIARPHGTATAEGGTNTLEFLEEVSLVREGMRRAAARGTCEIDRRGTGVDVA